jgi:hypothetical protein
LLYERAHGIAGVTLGSMSSASLAIDPLSRWLIFLALRCPASGNLMRPQIRVAARTLGVPAGNA